MTKDLCVEDNLQTRKEIAQRLELTRNNMHMTKIEFAHLIGISDQYYGTVAKGKNCLATDKLINFATNSGVSIDYLLLGKQSKNDEINSILESLSPSESQEMVTIMKSIFSFGNEHKKHTQIA